MTDPWPDPWPDYGVDREPITRWWLMWRLYGLPRCSQAHYPDPAPHCWRLIWPWQPRQVRNGAAVHESCLWGPLR